MGRPGVSLKTLVTAALVDNCMGTGVRRFHEKLRLPGFTEL